MLLHLLSILGGLVLLVAGADGLVKGATGLALRMGVSRLVIGLTVVALGTSSPELVVGIEATAEGDGPLVLGNIIGSNIANLALILGVCALIRPLQARAQLVRFDIPVMVVAVLVFIGVVQGGVVNRWEGVLLTLGAGLYTVLCFVIARSDRSRETQRMIEDTVEPPQGRASVDMLLAGLGLAALIWGGDLLVDGAVRLARLWGASEMLIGLTIVAIGTSLPELATCAVAAYRDVGDIALGNLIGSCILNVLLILGPTVLVAPIETASVLTLDLVVLLSVSVLVLPLSKTGNVIRRWEGGVLLTVYCFYLAYRIVATV